MPPKASARGKKANGKKIPAENKKTVAKITDYTITKGKKQNESELVEELKSEKIEIENNFNNEANESPKRKGIENRKVSKKLKVDKSDEIKSNGATEIVEDSGKEFEKSSDLNSSVNDLQIENECSKEVVAQNIIIQSEKVPDLDSNHNKNVPAKRGRPKLKASSRNVGSSEAVASKIDSDLVEEVSANSEEIGILASTKKKTIENGLQLKNVSDVERNNKAPPKRGRKKLNPPSKNIEFNENDEMACDTVAVPKNSEKNFTEPEENMENALADKKESSETDDSTVHVNSTLKKDVAVKRGRKKVSCTTNTLTNKTIKLEDSNTSNVDKSNENLELISKTELVNKEVNCMETKEVPLKRGRKKIGEDLSKKIIPCEDPKAEVKAPSKRGRKKIVLPLSEPCCSKNEETVSENVSIDDKDGSNLATQNKNVEPDAEIQSSHLEQNSVSEEKVCENQPDIETAESDTVTNEAMEENSKISEVLTQKQDSEEFKAPSKAGRKRKNLKSELASEDNKEIKPELSLFAKTVQVSLKREKKIEEMLESETKTVKKGGAKNTKGRGKRVKDEGDPDESSAKPPKVPKKESKGQSKKDQMPDVTLLDFNNSSVSPSGKPWNLKLSSWNVNGVRAWLEKKGLAYVEQESPDIICFQETKCSDKQLPKEVNVEGYFSYWLAGDKDGYSGVGMLSRKEPISIKYGIGIEEHDSEGRVITAEYENFYLVTAYIPNAGRGLVRLNYRMQWDKDFRSYIKSLDDKKPVVLCGDLNVAHEEIDLANPKTNKKNAGFTKEEREGFSTLLSDGFIDSFRHLHPDEKGAYTFWTYMMNARAKNVGWRLDYFVLSKRFTEHLCDSVIRKDVFGSDHCPITLFLSI